MSCNDEIHMPFQNHRHGYIFGKALKGCKNFGLQKNNPFFNIPKNKYDSDTVKRFIKALAGNGFDDAKVYLSKRFRAVDSLNFVELKKMFNKNSKYKYLNKMRFYEVPNNIVTSSILVTNSEIKSTNIIHVYMVKEPDIHSSWKICGIECE